MPIPDYPALMLPVLEFAATTVSGCITALRRAGPRKSDGTA
jgi:hypothetical protein